MKEEKSRRKVAILDNCEIDTLYRLKEENIPVELALDTILKELYEKNIIDKRINKLIDCVRSERKVIYFIKKKDSSSELRMEVIDNNKIRELLYSSDCEIIW
ncbi:hypothetical protein AALD74_09370 [Lachnospiraceae bacterium 48-21]